MYGIYISHGFLWYGPKKAGVRRFLELMQRPSGLTTIIKMYIRLSVWSVLPHDL
jgi:hypothetical protein